MIHLIIFGFAATGAWTLIVTISPVGRCLRCGGGKVLARGRRVRACPRCKATGRAYRPGAVLVHRLLREHLGPWIRERFRDAAGRRAEGDR